MAIQFNFIPGQLFKLQSHLNQPPTLSPLLSAARI